MTSIYKDISGKIDNSIVEAIDAIASIMAELSIPFFLVGASARDIVFSAIFDITTKRNTLDIDFGIRTHNWEEVNQLIDKMFASGLFKRDVKKRQRFIFKDSIMLDIIPFGGLEKPSGSVQWPPDDDFIMSTIGFEEAFQYSIMVRLKKNPDLDIKVCTPAGLVILKLIAWNENRQERGKDPKDILFIMEEYIEAGNANRLDAEDKDLRDVKDFDYGLASARLLGRDMGKIASPESREILNNILVKETDNESDRHLITDMLQGEFGRDDKVGQTLKMLQQLFLGFQEKQQE